MRMIFTWIKRVWCKLFHRRAMWPMHGRYICPKCLQEYLVYWEDDVLRKPATASARLVAYPPALPVAVPASGSADPSTYFTRASSVEPRNGFPKKCTSVAGIP